jgi:hypothetical protein
MRVGDGLRKGEKNGRESGQATVPTLTLRLTFLKGREGEDRVSSPLPSPRAREGAEDYSTLLSLYTRDHSKCKAM